MGDFMPKQRDSQTYFQRALQIMILMAAAGIAGAVAEGAPPTREERDKIKKNLDQAEGGFGAKKTETEKATALLDNLGKSIDALEKSLAPLKKDTPDDVGKEVAKMQDTLAKLKAIRTRTQAS